MLRVALCTDGVFPHAMGGMQRHSRLLAEHLARTGAVELTVLHPHPVGIFDAALGIREVHVPDIDKERFYLRELWRYSGRMAEQLRILKPDVVLSQGFSVWKDRGEFSDRLVVNPHGLEMFQGLTWKDRLIGLPFRRALRSILRRSTVAVSLGGKLTPILRQQVNGSPCEVVVVPNAVEVGDALVPAPASPGPLQLLFVGRFATNKGLDVLMTVARRLAQEHQDLARFQLAGDGPLMKELKEQGLPRNVELLGRVDDARLARLYRECDALVLPTRFEGMPTVVLEAMAQGKPILVSDVGATAELVGPHNGYLLPPGDPEALYNAVLAFAERPAEVRAKMGTYGRQRVIERFSWPVVAEAHVRLCREVAARARAEGRDPK